MRIPESENKIKMKPLAKKTIIGPITYEAKLILNTMYHLSNKNKINELIYRIDNIECYIEDQIFRNKKR